MQGGTDIRGSTEPLHHQNHSQKVSVVKLLPRLWSGESPLLETLAATENSSPQPTGCGRSGLH